MSDPLVMPPSADLIQRFTAYLRLAGKSPNTISEWQRVLTRFDLALPAGLDNADDAEITELLGSESWSPNTRRSYWQCLARFYRWATRPEDQWLALDPMAFVPTPPMPHRGVPHPCTDDQLTTLLRDSSQPYRLWFLIAAYAGLRALEIARLEREHITEDVIYVHGKGDKPGAVPTHRLIWAAVRHLPPGPLVRKVRGGRADGDYVSTMSNHYLHDRLGMRDMHIHRCRHWFGTKALEAAGGDVRVAQELLRHASPNTTAIYTQVALGRRSAAVNALPEVVAPGGCDDHPGQARDGR